MFLQIGRDVVVLANDLVAILSKDIVDKTSTMRKYLKTEEEKGQIRNQEEGDVKSLIIMKEGIYFSLRTVETLKKRLDDFLV